HVVVCFFFSSRRRHTRSKRDWSSDVCSSDLGCCFADISTGELNACVLSGGDLSEQLINELSRFSPREILLNPGALDFKELPAFKIGRASCRGRGEISGVRVASRRKVTCTAEE